MVLKNISVNHHKLFGSTKIDLFGESVPLENDLTKEHHTDILLEIDNDNKSNYYTFIIGQNGVGKTILFRTVVNFINANDGPIEEPKLKAIMNFYPKSRKYLEYKLDYSGVYELQELGIYNHYSIVNKVDIKNFLEYYGSYLVFISSSFERNIVHRNPRYRNFNYLSDINKTQTLFLKSLHKYREAEEKLEVLSKLLERDLIKWNLKGYLSVEGIGGIENDSIFLLKNTKGVNIINFLRTINKIEISDEKLIVESLDETEIKVFEAIYYSRVFFKFYFDSNLSLIDLFQEIKNSKVLIKIEHFINQKTSDPEIENHLNIRIPKTEKKDWEFLFTEINELSEFDVNTILLLEDLNLINLTISCNDVPVSHMSSGEQSIIRLFSYFADIPVKENLLVFFDEPENTLHPKWQQNFPIYFKRIIEEIYEIKKSHFIFSTHSPLIIMKSNSLDNSNVVRFYKDNQGKFQSQQITNINSFSIEEVLLDEFKISYRDQEIELVVNKILSERNDKIMENNDPIYSIEKSFELKDKINELFNSIKSGQ